MKLNSQQIEGLMKVIGLTREEELNCNQCLDHVAEFAECELSGRPVSAALKAVEHHLTLCKECREEYEALREALAEVKDEDG